MKAQLVRPPNLQPHLKQVRFGASFDEAQKGGTTSNARYLRNTQTVLPTWHRMEFELKRFIEDSA